MRYKIFSQVFLMLCLIWMLVSCQASKQQAVTTDAIFTPTPPRSNPSPGQTQAPIPTSTASPTKTSLPSLTPMVRVISAENASRVTAAKKLGKGTINNAPIYSTDGVLLAVPASTGIQIYDARTLEQVSLLPAGKGTPEIAFSPDGQTLAVTSFDAPVKIWDIRSATQVQELDSPAREAGSWFHDLHFSPDGQRLAATLTGDQFWMWNVADGALIYNIEGGFTNSFSPDWTWMVTSRWVTVNDISKRHAYLYQLSDGTLLNEWEADRALFSPSGYLAIESEGTTRLIDLKTNTVMAPFRGTQAAFSADGSKMALLRDRAILLVNLETGGILGTLEGSYGVVENLVFSPDGLAVAGFIDEMDPACCQGGTDTVSLWHTADGTLITSLHPEEYMPWLTFSPDGNLLAVSDVNRVRFLSTDDGSDQTQLEYNLPAGLVRFSADGASLLITRGSSVTGAEIWDVEGGELLRRFENVGENDWENDASFSPDGQLLAVRGDFWNLMTGQRMDELDKISEVLGMPPLRSAFSVDGKTIALGYGEGLAALWDMQANALTRKLEASQVGYTGEVISLEFSPDGKTLAVVYGYPDYIVQLWDVIGGERLIRLEGQLFRRVHFSPDGTQLLTVSDADSSAQGGGLQLWRAKDGKLLTATAAHGAISAAFSPDGSLVVSGAMDGTLRLWRVSDGELLNELPGHNGSVYGLDFSPNGELIASSATDGLIILWGISEP